MSNRLARETSPYLLQHANNPVDWYPWGDDAIETAKVRNLPILLSVGYSACHWCHVMERECFEDETIARQMNTGFVNIKVDREERPDIDDIYMTSVQAMTGQGGWPLTVFLTPEGIPFFGGTYFPPVGRGGHPGFPQILAAVSDAYKNRKEQLEDSGKHVIRHIEQLSEKEETLTKLDMSDLDAVYETLKNQFDWKFGGFGEQIKFPQALALDFLLRYHYSNSNSQALEMVEFSLKKMYAGGIYDHVGGGFHRYSTDKEWLVPHFEKMLYDNALLSLLYVHTFQATGNQFYREVALDIYRYVEREMTSNDGLFYSSQDADSEGEEGIYYTWTFNEIIDLLGEPKGIDAVSRINVSPKGNFGGRNIIHLGALQDQEIFSRLTDPLWVDDRETIRKHRENRISPFKDRKNIVSWNSLMVQSLAEGYLATGEDFLKQLAIQNIKTILEIKKTNKGLPRSYINNTTSGNAFLDDYSYLLNACLCLYEITFDEDWIVEAEALAEDMIQLFWDSRRSMFYDVSQGSSDLVIRPSNNYDNVIPSGMSQAITALLRIDRITGQGKYENIIISTFARISESKISAAMSLGAFWSTAHSFLTQPLELAVVAFSERDAAEFQAMVGKIFLPNRLFAGAIVVDSPRPKTKIWDSPLLRDRFPSDLQTTAFLCEGYTCQLPVRSPTELKRQILASLT